MIVNRQEQVSIDLRAIREFVRKLSKCIRLGGGEFNLCFVDDAEIARLNATFRRKARPTDVLSFPWQADIAGERRSSKTPSASLLAGKGSIREKVTTHQQKSDNLELANFLGDIVISAPTARRSAKAAGHSTAREIRWLILHGVLHLVGYDHETDNGRMTALEQSLRVRLNI